MPEFNESPILQHHDEQADTPADRQPPRLDDLPQSLVLIPAGLEVVPDSGKEPVQSEKEAVQAEKEAISQEEKETVKPSVQTDGWHAVWHGTRKDRRIAGIKASVFIASLVTIAVILALGTGLGIGLRNTNNMREDNSSGSAASNTSRLTPLTSTAAVAWPTSAEYRIGGSINASYYSRQGAWNGTGIALASQSFPEAVEDAPVGSLVLYFQHHTDDLRFMRLTTKGEWVGGFEIQSVATDAKNIRHFP